MVDRSPWPDVESELAFLRQRMRIFDEYQKSAYAAHAAEMKEDGQPPFKGITGYGKRMAAMLMMERDSLLETNAALQAEIARLEDQVQDLRVRIAYYEESP